MKLVVACDVDGTLDTSNGPVPVRRLLELQGYGAHVWIVSPSEKRPAGFREAIDSDRATNLRQVRLAEYAEDALAGTFLYLYISDNKDYDAARQTGFTYVEAAQFA